MSETFNELALRLAEIHEATQELFKQRRTIEAQVYAAYPALREGGKLVVGDWNVEATLRKQMDCTPWERETLPRTATGMLIKLRVKPLLKEPS